MFAKLSTSALRAAVGLIAAGCMSLVAATTTRAQTINVPADFPTIQQAIDSSNAGVEIVVAPGTYTVNFTMSFGCRPIRLRSSGGAGVTTIQNTTDRVFSFGCEPATAILEGFTIKGGGIYIGSSTPTIRNCVFTANNIFDGAAIDMENAGGLIEGCTFSNNSTPGAEAGGIRIRGDRGPAPTIRNCTFDNNRTNPNDGRGGAIRITARSAAIENCTFTNNTSANDGGAIYAHFFSNLTIRNSTFSGNTARWGNAIYCASDSSAPTNVTIDNSTFTNNGSTPAGEGNGGVIGVLTRANVLVRNCTFTGNRANSGGTFFVRGDNPPNTAVLTVEDSTITNSSSRFSGGAVYVDSNGGRVTFRRTIVTGSVSNQNAGGAFHIRDASTLDIVDSVLSNNDGNGNGGAIFGCCGAQVSVTGSTISGNSAGSGGAINLQNTGTSFTAVNTTFSGNSAFDGGAIRAEGGTTSTTLRNCRITGNDARVGGGIRFNDIVSFVLEGCLIADNIATACCGGGAYIANISGTGSRIANCTVVNNTNREGGSAGNGLDFDGAGASAVSVRNTICWGNRYLLDSLITGNLVARNGAAPSVQFCVVQGGFAGTGNTSTDPLFASAATGDYRLLPTSPGIDTGSNADVPATLTTDLLGNPRILNGDALGGATVDRGCFESVDCNGNGLPDWRDIATGSSTDLDGNGVPDECDGLFAINARTGTLYTAISPAMAAAVSGDELRITGLLFAATSLIDTQNKPLTLTSLGSIVQPVGGLYELDNLASLRTAAGQPLTVRGTLRTSPGSAADVSVGVLTVNAGATLLARSNSAFSIAATSSALGGQSRIEPGAVLSIDGPVTNTGTLTVMSGGTLITPGSLANTGTFTALGASIFAGSASLGGSTQLSNMQLTAATITVPVGGVLAANGEFYGAITNSARMVMTDQSLLVGSLTINSGATLAVQAGATTLIGPLTNNGVITGDFRDGPDALGGLTVEGSYTAGPAASLLVVPPTPFTAVMSVRDNVDIAIDSNTRFALNTIELALFGTGPLQTLEVMSRDIGPLVAGLDRTQSGNYPLGRLRLVAGSTVQLVDNHDNDGLGQTACEAIYTGTLIIEPGATLINPSCKVYYQTLDNRGTATVPANLVHIATGPTACNLADITGIGGPPSTPDGLITGDDFNAFISAFAAGDLLADITGIGGPPSTPDGLITGDDFNAFIAAFAQGCP